eukprot:m.125275 g.125275  ORF g.125275 m.125275 type:complete len:1533 (-) comp15614_c1_seq2:98-4696(-)
MLNIDYQTKADNQEVPFPVFLLFSLFSLFFFFFFLLVVAIVVASSRPCKCMSRSPPQGKESPLFMTRICFSDASMADHYQVSEVETFALQERPHAQANTHNNPNQRVMTEIAFLDEHGNVKERNMQDFMGSFHMHSEGRMVPSKAWGTLKFTTKNHSVPYLRLSVNDSPEDALNFVKGMLARKYTPHFDKPSLILSVTGGARNFTLPQRLENAISKGLRQAAQQTNAWVVTGGTNAGVMRLTGKIMEALSKTQTTFVPPTIGIATYGIVVDGESLTTENPPMLSHRYDITHKDDPKAALDDNHNLFFLVDNGTVNKFGVEIAFRAAFEAAAGKHYDAPVVTIVVQGGPGTLQTALQAVRQKTPLVVVDGSGLAADLIAYAYNFLHNPLSRYTSYTIEDLQQMVEKTFNAPPEKTAQFLEQILECVQEPSLVVVYNLQDSGPDEFDDCILQAAFNTDRSLLNKLKQAMYFDRIDVARKALAEASEEDIKQCINSNLMAALLNNKPNFVELYLSYDAKIYQLQPTDTKFDYSSRELNELPKFAHAIEELYRKEADRPHSHVRKLVELSNTDNTGRPLGRVATGKKNQQDPRRFNVTRLERIFSRLVSKDFEVKRKYSIYKDMDKEESVSADLEFQREAQAAHMLFLWAVCLDKYRMARMFWQRGDQSIINALVASRILDRLSTHHALSGPHLAEERAKMKHNSKKFENLAVGVLEECHNSDSNLTAQMLHAKNPMFNKKNAINIAYDANSLAFLSHPAVQSVINTDWYGQLRSITSFWTVLLAFFLPFVVLPFISFQGDETTEQEQERGYFTEEIADAVKKKTRSLWHKFARFYTAPYTRFISDLLSHLVLCILTSYYVLDDLADSLGAIEYILVVWFIALFLEELRQMIFFDGIWDYISDTWNRLDLTMLTLYFAGFVVRVVDPGQRSNQNAAKAIHAFLVVILWLRFMRYYALSKNLGPKLIMMMEMTKDVTTFIFLLFIFLIGYGVAAQSLLFPEQEFSTQTFINVLYRPYFQIYGELFLEDLDAESGCTGIYPFTSCGREEVRIMPIFLAVYVLVTNVLLINLLIAMFNDTYIKVQEEAEDLWRKQNYELFAEYKERPFLPAPFIVITHVYLLIQFLVKKCCGDKAEHHHVSVRKADERRKLTAFEEISTERFLRQSEQRQRDTLDERVKVTSEKVTRATDMMSVLLEHMVSFRTSLDRQIITLRNEIQEGLPDRLSLPAVPETPLGPRTRTLNKRSSSQALLGNKKSKALYYVPPLEYPNSGGVKRFMLEASMVPWKTEFTFYQPVDFTHPVVAKQPIWADPADPSTIHFGQKDLVDGKVVDRTTCHPDGIKLDPVTKRPINPWGRTGLTGRGLLGKWGVNQAADTVVTRWKRAADGSILERDGRKVLEFVAIQRIDNGMWAIPGGFVDNGEDIATTNGREFIEEALGIKEQNGRLSKEEEDAVNNLFSSGELVGRIYSSDPRNTDNAWVETFCVNFHDESGRYASRLRLQGGDDATHARWMMVHGGLNLFASHNKLIKLVTELHGAYY